MVYSTDRSKAVVPVLGLLCVALWFILRGDLFYVLPCVILFLCFSVLLALRLPRLGKRELTLVLFRTFVLFVLVWMCRFPLPLGVWEGLRFVIVALPGLFSYLFFSTSKEELQPIHRLGTVSRKLLRGRVLKLVLLVQNFTLNPDAAPNYIYMFRPHWNGILVVCFFNDEQLRNFVKIQILVYAVHNCKIAAQLVL